MILSYRFWEVFQIGLGKAFKIDGTIYTPDLFLPFLFFFIKISNLITFQNLNSYFFKDSPPDKVENTFSTPVVHNCRRDISPNFNVR